MIIVEHDRGYNLSYMEREDLLSLRELIRNGGLTESRKWHGVLAEINAILKNK